MVDALQILVVLLVVIAAVAVLARRLEIPSAILLVLTGVALALVPGLPSVRLAPEFVLLLVLPPVIYSSSVAMSWREFRFNLRPISMLAVGAVVFTTLAVAAVTHYILKLDWSVGFIVGAIVSPPDAVAPLSIARRMQLPRRILVILEGEGLANDATALILYRFAVVAVSVGVFSLGHALSTFAAIVVGEVIWGLIVGWIMLRLRRWVAETRIEILLSVLTPFVAYWPPEHFGGSGVLATVTTGLYISWNGLRLISADTRLQGIFFWDFLIYMTEGMIFLVTGLQARTLVGGISGYSLRELVVSGAVVCAVVILARAIWLYPATYLPRLLVRSIARDDPAPPWQWPFVLSFTGVRGIVSIAAALAIPFFTEDGRRFPDRDLILFLTFAVILVTLVGQGLMLPSVIRWLGLADAGRLERQAVRAEEFAARRLAIESAIEHLDDLTTARGLSLEVVAPIRAHQQSRLNQVWHRSEDGESHQRIIALSDEIERSLIGIERDQINDLYRAGKLKDEARRRIERDLDLREARLTNLLANE
ncbi:MAG TPA: Na+/H+ antiporter [Steroidobacteraceae bacterium]|jgi:CPA1 family monovalent cation:H+ antiporter